MNPLLLLDSYQRKISPTGWAVQLERQQIPYEFHKSLSEFQRLQKTFRLYAGVLAALPPKEILDLITLLSTSEVPLFLQASSVLDDEVREYRRKKSEVFLISGIQDVCEALSLLTRYFPRTTSQGTQ